MYKTIEEIKENLAFAAEVMRRLPPVKVQGYLCAWPKFCCTDDDFKSQSDVWLPPLPDEISAMEEILEWLKLTSVENRRIVWLRSCGMGWKSMAHRYRKSRSTLARQYRSALTEIQKALENMTEEEKRHFDESLSPSWFEGNR